MCWAWEYLKYVVQIADSFGRAGRRCARRTTGAAASPRSSERREIFIMAPRRVCGFRRQAEAALIRDARGRVQCHPLALGRNRDLVRRLHTIRQRVLDLVLMQQ